MDYSYVIQAVIRVVIHAVPADFPEVSGAIKIGCPLRVTGVRGPGSQGLGWSVA